MSQAEYDGHIVAAEECVEDHENMGDDDDEEEESETFSQGDEDNAALIEELETHVMLYTQPHVDFEVGDMFGGTAEWDPLESPRKRLRRLD